ncbi:hypothetical protein SAMN04488003_109101 [Loktanella fryxellensis]|uniref:DUF2157 domain-containing protein n=1 Tax=Loktanella fryxellensis TaxID=245187 RepID=A0A1H8DXQ5_9RHOB|nr:hypothetical protein [Loktanella fryxellensis]SEN12111.1 hypothetical protein SAMN04488003_109101 [Loktanella fryxellensis]
MIDRDDLRAATGAGIISEAQAATLAALADSRRGARTDLAEGDEPFELFKGFNEVFIVVGLVILAFGWVGVAALFVDLGQRSQGAVLGIVTGLIAWLLSEYFVRRRRMVAPAMTLAVMFALTALGTFAVWFAQPFMVAQQDYSSLPWPAIAATAAVLVYWARFRVPFALAIVAIGLFIAAILLAATARGTPATFVELFRLSADGPFAWITLVLGVAVFAVAMWFDMSDPHRVTRRAANGFWLHVVAAPALVNTVALSLLDRNSGTANLILLVVLLGFAIVAIVIDRRSFLIAAIGYIVVLSATVFDGDGAAIPVLLLGVGLLILGAFWQRIRSALLRPLAGVLPLHRLPPADI